MRQQETIPEGKGCPGELKYDYSIDLTNKNSSHTKIIEWTGEKKRVLEIGCASGYMTRCLKEKLCCTVFCVEIDDQAAKSAEPFAEKLVIGDIETLSMEESFQGLLFDVVIMADVIEHLTNPQAVLEKIQNWISPSGCLLLSVPNGAHGAIALEVLDGKWDYRETGLLDHTHLHFFDKDALTRLLDATGYFISRIGRVIVHPRDTEMKTPWDQYPRDVTAYLEKVNPEYQTYQFIIKACPTSDMSWRRGIEDSLAYEREQAEELRKSLAEQRVDYDFLLAKHAGFEQELKKRADEYLENLKKETERLEAEKADIHAGYKGELERREKEILSIHEKYEEVISRQNDEIVQLNTVHLAWEKESVHQQTEIEKLKFDLVRYTDNIKLTEHERSRLEQMRNDYKSQLDEIQRSMAWRILTKYRLFLFRLFPDGSRRYHYYRSTMRSLELLYKEGIVAFVRTIRSKLPFKKKMEEKVLLSPETSPSFQPLIFPEHETPLVSIVIPVFNQVHYTYHCLVSVLQHTASSYEVIVVDNASMDDTGAMLAQVKGVTVIRNMENRGFVDACNQGAAASKGAFLFFLNNDTQVTSGWLEALIKTFERERVGAVGAKLIYPNGKLQEAGGIIFRDGAGWNYGRGDEPDLPQYAYLKEVDYCSGAALMIRKEIWDELGGFDTRYAPAYYEDTDLCFGVRNLGYKVMYQPESRIIHYEGISAGTDLTKGYKKYQQLNRMKFMEKWLDTLKRDHCDGPDKLFLARERGCQKVLMVVDHYVPEFDKDSGSFRMFNLLTVFVKLGFKVIFWPDNMACHPRYTTALQQLGIEVLYGAINFVDYIIANKSFIDIILLSRPHIAINYMFNVKKHTTARIIYDTVDLHFLREERNALLHAGAPEEAEIRKIAEEWKKTEMFLADQADLIFVVSPFEKTILEQAGFAGKVTVVSNVHSLESCKNDFPNRKGLMFIAGFVHRPNEDGIVWFVEHIFPAIRKRLPDISLTIVGSNPTAKVQALSSSAITVTGYVADVTPYFETSRVFISPLRYGAGVKGKIGQSMAYGLPVVTTSIGAEGMGLTDGEHVLIADDEVSFADKVIALYQNEALWRRLSEQGRRQIETVYSPEVLMTNLDGVFKGLMGVV